MLTEKEIVDAAIALMAAGKTQTEAANELQVAEATLSRWLKKARNAQEPQPEREFEEAQPVTMDRLDEAADNLLQRMQDPKTSDMQAQRLFAQVVAWYKVRDKLKPSPGGEGLREMTDELRNRKQTAGGGGTGSAGQRRGKRAAGSGSSTPGASAHRDGAAIREIIGSLPPLGGRVRGDSGGAEREGGGAPGNGRGVPADGGGAVPGDVDGARRLN